MTNTFFIVFSLIVGAVSSAHLIESQERTRPIDIHWTHQYKVTSLLQDFKHDGFMLDLERSKAILKNASSIEAERLEIKAKHQIAVYEKTLKEIRLLEKELLESESSKEKEEIEHLFFEVKSRIILTQFIQNLARRKLNDSLLQDFDNREEMKMELKAPKLFDDSSFPEYRPKPPKPTLWIEPK